jgi:hypothetical protein
MPSHKLKNGARRHFHISSPFPLCNHSTTNILLIYRSFLRGFWLWLITLGVKRIPGFVPRCWGNKEHNASVAGKCFPRWKSGKSHTEVGHAIHSRYELMLLLMQVTNYLGPPSITRVLIKTFASTLRIQMSLIHYHEECKSYILRSKCNVVRIKMGYSVCVIGFGSLITEHSTFQQW